MYRLQVTLLTVANKPVTVRRSHSRCECRTARTNIEAPTVTHQTKVRFQKRKSTPCDHLASALAFRCESRWELADRRFSLSGELYRPPPTAPSSPESPNTTGKGRLEGSEDVSASLGRDA
jgi:hypothetical protein